MTVVASLTGGAHFESKFKGPIIDAASRDYDSARAVWNGGVDCRPLAVVRATDVDDVVEAVRLGRETGLAVAVRGGGHSYQGHSTVDDGLIIDLSLMSAVSVDPGAGTATAQGGALLRTVDDATSMHGLVVPAGIVSHTGLAGLALGGGIGYLSRSLGLTCDHFLRLQVVTADGDVIEASETDHPDLFWALRGGGGNFGIVTEFHLRANVLGPVQAGRLYFPMSQAADAIRGLAAIVEQSPRQMSASFGLAVDPAMTPVGELPGSERVLAAGIVYLGEPDDEALRAVTSYGHPLFMGVTTANFVDIQRTFDKISAHGIGWYMKSGHSRELTESLIDRMVEAALDHRKIASPHVKREVYGIQTLGGAVSDVAEDATAYSGREAKWHCAVEVGFTTPQERERVVGWTREGWATTETYLDMRTSYVNMMVDDNPNLLRNVYGDSKLERLRDVKSSYDPGNFFRLNPNIVPRSTPMPSLDRRSH